MDAHSAPIDWQALGTKTMVDYNALPLAEREAFISATIADLQLLTEELKDLSQVQEVEAGLNEVGNG